jgi:flagellar FliL protein
MAKVEEAPEPPTAATPAAAPSVLSFILAMAVVTGLSVGAGGMFGLQVLAKKQPPPAKSDAQAAEGRKGRFSDKASLHALAPIITNLASPERTWIRLEASIVIDAETADAKALSVAVTEDTVAYLRTLSLPLIEGASGLLHLREDLNDRVRVRSGGKVRDLVVHTLIVE